MNKTPEISVVVPIYKVEKFLRRCLLSIQKQTFADFEVLIIDDGSPDKSPEIAEEFCKSDSRFILYHKENGGLSDARNFGIDRVRGKYIAFIDSDDHLHKDYLRLLHAACVKNNADMAYCKYTYSYFNTGLKCPRPSGAKTGFLTKEEALNRLISDKFQSYAWNKLYRTEIFTKYGIRYPYMYFEDIATSARLLHRSNGLAVCGRHLYYYEKRFGSIVGTMNAEKINDYWRSALSLRNYFQYVGEYEKYKPAILKCAKNVRSINVYSIVRQHILNLDFRKLRYNLDTNKDIYNYVTSDDYVAVDGIPDIPYKLVQPGRKNRPTKEKKYKI